MTYTLYFSIYGKKMKCQIDAYDREGAIELLRQKIVIHRVDEEREPCLDGNDPDVEYLKSIFGIK